MLAWATGLFAVLQVGVVQALDALLGRCADAEDFRQAECFSFAVPCVFQAVTVELVFADCLALWFFSSETDEFPSGDIGVSFFF